MHKILFVNGLAFFLILYSLQLKAQPNNSSRQTIHGVEIYQDYIKLYKYYYVPSDLSLVVDENGKPSFQLLKMRYTGTKCYADAGEHHFTNIIRLTVKMESYATATLKTIAAKLKKTRNVLLKPLPISHIESQLILPVVQDDKSIKNQVLGEQRSLESTDEKGLSGSKKFWTSRAFMVKLKNNEAELLTEQLENNQLSMSFDYSFYAGMKIKSAVENEMTGTKELMEAVKNQLDSAGEYNKTTLVKSDAFQIEIDLTRFPELVKEIDINESIPPTYPAVEIKCYDFTENLRPDLYMKKVEVEAQSVDGTREVIVETKFYKKHAELNTQHLHFPYAINMDAPMRYRVNEISTQGETKVSAWKNKEECSELIDVTTPIEDINIHEYQLETEIDEAVFEDSAVVSVTMEITWLLNGKKQALELVYTPSDAIFTKNSTFFYDKNTSVRFQLIKKINVGLEQKTEKQKLHQDYFYISENQFEENAK